MDGDWTCACGRANPAARAKCPACGEARGAARPAAPRPRARLARVDEVTPIPPNPPGAAPFAWTTATLALTLPKSCACCLGPPARQPFEIYATKHDVEWDRVLSTAVGCLSFAVTGFGWYYKSYEKSLEQTLRCPLCDACRRHETSWQIACLVAGAAAAVGFVATLRKAPESVSWWKLALGWAGAGIVLAFVVDLLLGSRRSATCVSGRPVRLGWGSDAFRLTFRNASFGQRVAELNGPRSVGPLVESEAIGPRVEAAGLRAQEPARRLGARPSARFLEPAPAAAPGAPPVAPGVATPVVSAADGEHVVAVYPAPDVSPEQVKAYASSVGLGLPDARTQLEVPFPRVAGVGTRDEAENLAARLRPAGLACRIAPSASVLTTLEPRRVKRIESLEPLVVDAADGNGIGAARARLALGAGARLVVVGKWLVTAGAIAGDVHDAIRFVHLYVGEDERPYELVERDFLDYSFLGSRRAPSARTNFDAVIESLAATPGGRIDRTLLDDAGRVPRQVEVAGAGAWAGAQTTQAPADIISRLIRIAWRDTTGASTTPG